MTTLTGCVSLESPSLGLIAVGSETSSMAVTLAPDVATLDGPVVVDMEVAVSDTVLPSSSMRVTFGDGTTALATTFERVDGVTTTTLDGPMQLGVGCMSLPCNENVDITLTGVAFRTSETCGRQHPTSAWPRCRACAPPPAASSPRSTSAASATVGMGGTRSLPTDVTMRFTEATPTDRRIQIDAARGVCRLVPGRECNEPGAAWLLDDTPCGM
ncbi:MAG: hypothetical protein M5U28_19955 [Sandaracinaceae bacterium]|nr:hypothetical protein [Sandaracinaceae bacterium]